MTAAFALFIAIAAGQVIAQTASYLGELPPCAKQPIAKANNAADCTTSETGIICTDQSLLHTIVTTIEDSYSEADSNLALGAVSGICGVTSGSTSIGPEDEPHSTTATVSAPGLTTTFLMSPQPTSVVPSFHFSTLFPSTGFDDASEGYTSPLTISEDLAASSTSIDILSDPNVMIIGVPTDTTTKANFSRTMTYGTTSSPSPTGGASSDMVRLWGAAMGIGAMGLIFAEL